MKFDDFKIRLMKADMVSTYETLLDEVLDLCKSPIESNFLINLLNYFLKQVKSPMGFSFFQPIYGMKDKTYKLECIGVEIIGSDESEYHAKNGNMTRVKPTRISIVIVPQTELNIQGKKYILDFGVIVTNLYNPDSKELKIAIECDGHEYHSTKESIRNDNFRMRQIATEGWQFMRYSGSEINSFSTTNFQNEIAKIILLINNHFELERFSNFSIFHDSKRKPF
jgi:very-short-patch-repair endonuclease